MLKSVAETFVLRNSNVSVVGAVRSFTFLAELPDAQIASIVSCNLELGNSTMNLTVASMLLF